MTRQNRRERSWREVEKIVGAGVHCLPEFFKNGLYSLTRAGLADSEIVLAYQRCCSWIARAKDGFGECECGCGTRLPVDEVNGQGVSVWNLDHDKHTKTFRGVLFQQCNREIGCRDRTRKWAHFDYIEKHLARLKIESNRDCVGFDDFLSPGAVLD